MSKVFDNTTIFDRISMEYMKEKEDMDISLIKELSLNLPPKDINKRTSLPDVDDKKLGFTLLMEAIYNNHYNIAKILVEKGADVNVTDKCGYSGLMYSCSKGYYEIAELLLKNDIDVNSKSNCKSTALMKAASNGNLKLVILLLEYDADINEGSKQWTPLTHSISKDHIEVTELLLNNNAEITEICIDKAKQGNNKLMINLLNKFGADIEFSDNNNNNNEDFDINHPYFLWGRPDKYGNRKNYIKKRGKKRKYSEIEEA